MITLSNLETNSGGVVSKNHVLCL